MKAPSKKVLQEQIRKINMATAVVSAVLAVVSATLLATTNVSLWLSYMARDLLAPGEKVVLAPAFKELFSVEARYLLAGVFALSAILSVLLFTKLRANYETTLKAKVSGYKWIFAGLTAAYLFELVNLLAGISDLAVLKVVGGLVFIASLACWLAERENDGATKKKWLAFVVAVFAGIGAWLPLAGSFFGTAIYGMERFTWGVYALAGTLLISFILYGLNQYYYLSGRKGWKEYLFIERNHLAINFATVLAFGLIATAAFYK